MSRNFRVADRHTLRHEIEGVLQDLIAAVQAAPITRRLPDSPHAVAQKILELLEMHSG